MTARRSRVKHTFNSGPLRTVSDNPQDLIALTTPARAKSSSASFKPFMWPSTWPERYDN